MQKETTINYFNSENKINILNLTKVGMWSFHEIRIYYFGCSKLRY